MPIATPYNPKQFQFVRPRPRRGGDPIAALLTAVGTGIMTAQQRKDAKEEQAFERALKEAREARAQEAHDVTMQEKRSKEDDRVEAEEAVRVAGIKTGAEAEAGDSLKNVFLQKRQGEIAGAIHRQYPDMTPDEVEDMAKGFADEGMTPSQAVDKMLDREAKGALIGQREASATGGGSSAGGVSGVRLERDQLTDEAIKAADQAIAYLKEQYAKDPTTALAPEKWADQVSAFVNSKFEGINQSTFQVRMKGLLDRARTELNLGEDLGEATPTGAIQ